MSRGPDALRAQKHDQHQRQAVEQLAQHFRVNQHFAKQRLLYRRRLAAQQLRQRGQQHRAEDHAGDMPHPAQHHHRQNRNRLLQGKRFRRNEALKCAEQRARHAAE